MKVAAYLFSIIGTLLGLGCTFFYGVFAVGGLDPVFLALLGGSLGGLVAGIVGIVKTARSKPKAGLTLGLISFVLGVLGFALLVMVVTGLSYAMRDG